MNTTLGARLRGIQQELAQHGTASERHRKRVGEERWKAQQAQLEALFVSLKRVITSQIESGKIPKLPEINTGDPFSFGSLSQGNGQTPDQPEHPFHFVWLDLDRWLAENELQISFKWTHDGGGMRDWYIATVTPRDPQ